MNIKEMSATFENGDKLILTLKELKFAGYNFRKLWELFYAEKFMEHGNACYNAIQTEYFPEDCASQAIQAFNIRRTCNNPIHESDQGYDLNKILSIDILPGLQSGEYVKFKFNTTRQL